MVNDPGATSAPSPYAPVNEQTRGGLVSYLANGAGFVVRARREDAYRKMYRACGGRYRIDAEGPRAAGGTIIAAGPNAAVMVPSTYWYIQFSCVAAQPPPAAAGRPDGGAHAANPWASD
jgi:hypothetical protein